MKQREKTMALVLIVLMTVVLGGLVYFQYYASQVRALDTRQRTLDDDADNANLELAKISTAAGRLGQAKKLSLPADVAASKRDYNLYLEKQLRDSGFPKAAPPTIVLKQSELRAATPAAKRPPYTKLTYDVRGSGNLQSLVEFLDRFYRTPLLHRIRSLTLTRPQTVTRGQDKESLDILITIEALILDGAENRKTLIAADLKKEDFPNRLAHSTSQYAMIAGNNVFFGPYVPPSLPSEERVKKDSKFLSFVQFNVATIDDNGVKAQLYDHYHQNFYVIRKRPTATSYRIDTYEQVKGRKIRGDVGEESLTIKDGNGTEYHKYKVLRVDLGDIFLEEAGTRYRLHVGDMLSQAVKLTDAEAKLFNLPATGKQNEKKEPEKKSSGKVQSAASQSDTAAKPVETKETANKEEGKD